MSDIRARMSHIREAKLCAAGARQWCITYDYPWNDFLENGISVEDLEKTGDVFALKVAAIARREHENGRRR